MGSDGLACYKYVAPTGASPNGSQALEDPCEEHSKLRALQTLRDPAKPLECRAFPRFAPAFKAFPAYAAYGRSRVCTRRMTLAASWQFSWIWKSNMPTAMKSAPFLKA